MNLDDLPAFVELDSKNIYAHLDSFPEQVESAWLLGQAGELPAGQNACQVIIAGMGTSAVGAELAAAYLADICPAPVVIHRAAGLPAWAHGPETMLIVSSYTGNTQEALSAFQTGLERACTCIVMTTGGLLAEQAAQAGVKTWRYPDTSPMGSSIAAAFALPLAALERIFGLPDQGEQLTGAVEALKQQRDGLRREIPAALNPGKRMGGQLVGRWITVMGEGILAGAARYWKLQFNELGKAGAAWEALPEADHNTIYAVVHPEEHLPGSLVLFLRAPTEDAQTRQHSNATRKFFMLQGISTDFVDARGTTRLANLLTILHFGDYMAYYQAMAYGIDPSAETILAAFKAELDSQTKF